MPESSIKQMTAMIGVLPAGDVPAAWWSSTHVDVLKGYDRYKVQLAKWQSGYKELLNTLGLPPNSQYVAHARVRFAGIVPPTGVPAPRWMRLDKDGYLVPRKRTKAEKGGPIQLAYEELQEIPQAIEYLPGISDSIHIEGQIYPIQVRQPGKAVLAFSAVSPEDGAEDFAVGPQWSRMKLSTFHLLRERQDAGQW